MSVWVYGKHTVFNLLQQGQSKVLRIMATDRYRDDFDSKYNGLISIKSKIEIDKILGDNTKTHQGIAALIEPKAPVQLKDIAEARRVVILDEVTDVHNLGAIIRSAVAFNIEAIIVSKKLSIRSKPEIYKTSTGYIDALPIVEVTNIAQSMQQLKGYGFWILGMQLNDSLPIENVDKSMNYAIVLGAEGKGLRALTQKHCDLFAHIPINKACESLNVSVAAGITFYQLQI